VRKINHSTDLIKKALSELLKNREYHLASPAEKLNMLKRKYRELFESGESGQKPEKQ
jgi:hypothetical protein